MIQIKKYDIQEDLTNFPIMVEVEKLREERQLNIEYAFSAYLELQKTIYNTSSNQHRINRAETRFTISKMLFAAMIRVKTNTN